jgi:hypothetical protein
LQYPHVIGHSCSPMNSGVAAHGTFPVMNALHYGVAHGCDATWIETCMMRAEEASTAVCW